VEGCVDWEYLVCFSEEVFGRRTINAARVPLFDFWELSEVAEFGGDATAT